MLVRATTFPLLSTSRSRTLLDALAPSSASLYSASAYMTRRHSTFTYRLAAASAAKRTPPRAPKLLRDFWPYASTQREHSPPYLRSTKADAGEDAFFATTVASSPHHVAFGVADGVGGWVDNGVDPSLFAQALMYHAHRYCKQAWAGEPEIDPLRKYEEKEAVEGWELTPQECMELAHGGVMRERVVEAGENMFNFR